MDKRVIYVVDAIGEDLCKEIQLTEIAGSVNLSPSRLRHLFKEETGLSLKQYLTKLRIEKAKELIETSFLSLKEIRVKVGIFDKNHFAREFKKLYEISPSKYRKKCLS